MTEQPTSWFYEEPDGSGVAAFMCLTDFECEVGAANGGNRVFPSVDDLRKHKPCVSGCGIVEVRIVGVRVVQPASHYDEQEGDAA